ncbi:MAG: hypothetical protein NPINA01_05910 [Nitrospinaceae bacterium]|nr:MAG: hypothetical protein NPINA01_05910 [Nitrospinaceae bacterium]
MSDEDWKDPYEENGITLGPEEALRREIEKSKTLKVERLKLKDEVEKLRSENALLTRNIEALRKNPPEQQPPLPKKVPFPSPKLSLFLLIFNLGALGILLFFLFHK